MNLDATKLFSIHQQIIKILNTKQSISLWEVATEMPDAISTATGEMKLQHPTNGTEVVLAENVSQEFSEVVFGMISRDTLKLQPIPLEKLTPAENIQLVLGIDTDSIQSHEGDRVGCKMELLKGERFSVECGECMN